jgi:hypothetical protein
VLDFRCDDPEQRQRLAALTVATLANVDAGRTGMVHDSRLATDAADSAVFEAGVMMLSDDLLPAVVAAFDPGANALGRGRAAACMRLTARGRALFNGDWARPSGDPRSIAGYGSERGLRLTIGDAAAARIAPPGSDASDVLLVRVDDLQFLHFASGIGFAVISLSVPYAASSDAVLEALHDITAVRGRKTLSWACVNDRTRGFTLPDLLEPVLSAASCGLQGWNRLFTASYLRLAALPEDGSPEQLAWRLSRHYTSAYVPAEASALVGTMVLRPFSDIVHAASLEGVSMVAGGEEGFVATGLLDRFETAYFPLALLAYHEFVMLLGLSQDAAVADPTDGRASSGALLALVDQFLAFRLRYRLPVVSGVTMHNQVYAGMRVALQLEHLDGKIGGDVAEAERQLRRRQVDAETLRAAQEAAEAEARHVEAESAFRARERARAWPLGLFAGFLTFLTVYAAAKEVKVLTASMFDLKLWEWLPFACAVAMAFYAARITHVRQRDENREPEHGPALTGRSHTHHHSHTASHVNADRQHEAAITAAKGTTAAAAAATEGGH